MSKKFPYSLRERLEKLPSVLNSVTLMLVILSSCDSKVSADQRVESGDFWATIVPEERDDSHQDLVTYVLSVGRRDGVDLFKHGSKEDQENLVQYYSFQVQHDVYVSQGDVRIPAAFCHLERSFGLVPYRNIIVAFEADGWDDQMPYQVIVDSSELMPERLTLSLPQTTDG